MLPAQRVRRRTRSSRIRDRNARTAARPACLALFCACLAWSGDPDAAQWASHYPAASGVSIAYSVQALPDGAFVGAGAYSLAGDQYAWAFKVDRDGQVAWQRAFGYGNQFDHMLSSVQPTPDGGYVAAGWIDKAQGGRDAWVLKLDAMGGIVWQKTYGGTGANAFNSIRPTSDGGFVAAGYTVLSVEWIVKLDAAGNIAWQRAYTRPFFHQANDIVQTMDGGYVVAGRRVASSTSADWDASLLKLDASGGIEWQRTYGGAGIELAYAIRQVPDGGYVVAGESNSFGSGRADAWVLRLDAGGSVVWQRAYGGPGDDHAYAIALAPDGGYLVAGDTRSFGDGIHYDAWIVKLDAGGNIGWQRAFGGAYDDFGRAAQATLDGGYIVAGYGQRPLEQAFLLKLDASGTVGGCSELLSTRALAVTTAAPAPAVTAAPYTPPTTAAASTAATQSPAPAVEQTCRAAQSLRVATAVEYYHRDYDHYFVTSLPAEIAALDAGTFAGWSRTGLSFDVLPLDATGAAGVCRFWSGQTFVTKSSHFYTPFADECEIVKGNHDWTFEGSVFAIPLPDAVGACGAATLPVYRLYNDGQGGAPNHRYTTWPDTRAEMIARGWIPEGAGIGVIACAPAP